MFEWCTQRRTAPHSIIWRNAAGCADSFAPHRASRGWEAGELVPGVNSRPSRFGASFILTVQEAALTGKGLRDRVRRINSGYGQEGTVQLVLPLVQIVHRGTINGAPETLKVQSA
eukprot:gene26-biopygen5441